MLITGAAGQIGSSFAPFAAERYDLRLMHCALDRAERVEALRAHGEVVAGDVHDLSRMKVLASGIDAIVHLAALGNANCTWDQLLPVNIVGTYNVFAAAKSAGCRRVVFASSIHAVSGYPREVQVREGDAPNPGDLYGVSKCFGEALARYMAGQEGVSSIVVRIGAWCPPRLEGGEFRDHHLDVYVAPADLNELLLRAIEMPEPFAILHAVGDNTFARLDTTETRRVTGWSPRADAWEHLGIRQRLQKLNLKDGWQKSGLRNDLTPPGA